VLFRPWAEPDCRDEVVFQLVDEYHRQRRLHVLEAKIARARAANQRREETEWQRVLRKHPEWKNDAHEASNGYTPAMEMALQYIDLKRWIDRRDVARLWQIVISRAQGRSAFPHLVSKEFAEDWRAVRAVEALRAMPDVSKPYLRRRVREANENCGWGYVLLAEIGAREILPELRESVHAAVRAGVFSLSESDDEVLQQLPVDIRDSATATDYFYALALLEPFEAEFLLILCRDHGHYLLRDAADTVLSETQRWRRP
jgi:hypothetical protein